MKNRHLDSEEAATATEYIVLVVLVALALFVGSSFLGSALNNGFSDAGQELQTP